MSLLGWPRSSLLSIKEAQTEYHELARMAEALPFSIKVAIGVITAGVTVTLGMSVCVTGSIGFTPVI